MVLAAIIPTAAGAVWHGQRGFAAFTGVAASKKSSRLAVKCSAGQDDGSVGRETPAVAAPSGAQQLSLNGLAPTPATATSKRGKCALDKGKRKREDIGAAERPPLMLSEQKTPKDKKDHDKYCHFCQVFFWDSCFVPALTVLTSPSLARTLRSLLGVLWAWYSVNQIQIFLPASHRCARCRHLHRETVVIFGK